MAAAAILKFGKMSITLDWIKISAPYFTGICTEPCGDDHVTKCRNRKLIRVTSSNERQKHKCADLSDYNRTKFGTQHKYHTVNTPVWPNSHNLKIHDGGGRHLEFRKNVNNSGLYKTYMHQIVCEDASWSCGDDHVTKCRNRKLIRVTSSTNV